MYLIVETIIFQEVSLDKKCLVKLILPSSFETGLVLVICLSTKFEPSLTFVWKLSSLKEVTVRTEPHYGVTCSITLFLTGKILRLAQFGSVLRRGGLAQSFGRGGYCKGLCHLEILQRIPVPAFLRNSLLFVNFFVRNWNFFLFLPIGRFSAPAKTNKQVSVPYKKINKQEWVL